MMEENYDDDDYYISMTTCHTFKKKQQQQLVSSHDVIFQDDSFAHLFVSQCSSLQSVSDKRGLLW